jgi:glutamine synthetase
MLAAGLEGIEKEYEVPDPVDMIGECKGGL